MKKRTKIICTIGPACNSVETLEKMVEAGMNIARLNFSHGTHKDHAALINNIKKVAKKTNEPIAIIQDLQGPKIRLGILPDEGVKLEVGEEIIFSSATKAYVNGIIPIDYPLHNYLKAGERVYLNDGRSEVKVTRVEKSNIHTKVVAGGIVTSHKGMNVPDSTLDSCAISEKDKEDAKFGVKARVDFIALSFVNGPEDVLELKQLIKNYEKEFKIKAEQPIRVIAKIERAQAIENIEKILEVADGVMVARGDLGIEIPAQKVPVIQKQIIKLALEKEKPVIVATQMLDSMRTQSMPTRAEVSDVANAVIDHTDAVMLSDETAMGKHPVQAVTVMSNIIKEVETSHLSTLLIREHTIDNRYQIDDIISGLSRRLAEKIGAKIILTASVSGDTGRLLSRYRPEVPIYVGTHIETVRNQLNLSWGVSPFLLKRCKLIEQLVKNSVVILKKDDVVKKGDKMIVVAGEPIGEHGYVNLLEVKDVT